jgi:hypothetical protein
VACEPLHTATILTVMHMRRIFSGWCMADDASPSTDGWIDQVTLGHRYIHDTLNGTIPKYAWHIGEYPYFASHTVV